MSITRTLLLRTIRPLIRGILDPLSRSDILALSPKTYEQEVEERSELFCLITSGIRQSAVTRIEKEFQFDQEKGELLPALTGGIRQSAVTWIEKEFQFDQEKGKLKTGITGGEIYAK